jgi:hypothetical protein
MKTIKITQTNYLEALKYLFSELDYILNKNTNLNNITTNGNLASILQESLKYELFKVDTKQQANNQQLLYSIGIFNNLLLNVNKLQLWTDNKIYLKNDEEIIEIIEIEDKNDILI